MTKFEPLTPEQAKRTEQEALRKFSAEEKQLPSDRSSRVVKYKGDRDYRSRTPLWARSWLAKYFPPFRSQSLAKKETDRYIEYKETEELDRKSRVLERFKSIFPFMLFPDELVVEENRVIWKNRLGPGMTSVISIMATDISNVQASHGPIFGHIHVGSLVGGPEILVEKLSRKDVVRARALIEGIIIAAREKTAVRKKEVAEEEEELTKLGEVKF